MPITGRGSPSRLAIYHQDNVPGATSAVYLFPLTRTGIVVLANTYELTDVPDWIAQILSETLFEDDTGANYIQLTEEVVDSYQKWCSKTAHDFNEAAET